MARYFDSSEIQPYQFEPLVDVSEDIIHSSESDAPEDDDDEEDINVNRLANTHWYVIILRVLCIAIYVGFVQLPTH